MALESVWRSASRRRSGRLRSWRCRRFRSRRCSWRRCHNFEIHCHACEVIIQSGNRNRSGSHLCIIAPGKGIIRSFLQYSRTKFYSRLRSQCTSFISLVPNRRNGTSFQRDHISGFSGIISRIFNGKSENLIIRRSPDRIKFHAVRWNLSALVRMTTLFQKSKYTSIITKFVFL